MKAMKLSLVIMAAALLTIGLGGMAYAFHAGGVADCAGCHSMHSPMGVHLLVASDASSTCLTCHEGASDTGPSSFHVSTAQASLTAGTAPLQRGPGGDFAWLKKTYSYTAHGTATTEDGSVHGHNIIAADKNYVVDPTFSQSPGGSFLSSSLGCDSCHDPHGKGRRDSSGNYSTTGAPIIASGSTGTIPTAGQAVGLYRILAWPGYNTAGQNFTTWPIAVSPSTYNQTEAVNMVRVAYGGGGGVNGWGKWCGACHAAIANMTGLTGHPSHPVDQAITTAFATNYNNYVKSGDMTADFAAAGSPGPYSSLVPYQEGTSDIGILASHARNNNTVLGGPTGTDEVTCYSCHRAHASGWTNGLRWNNTTTFIVNGGAYPAEQGRTAIETQGAYYDRPPTVFASFQRSLCNKCHAKD